MLKYMTIGIPLNLVIIPTCYCANNNIDVNSEVKNSYITFIRDIDCLIVDYDSDKHFYYSITLSWSIITGGVQF